METVLKYAAFASKTEACKYINEHVVVSFHQPFTPLWIMLLMPAAA